jgi:hypothetical protein
MDALAVGVHALAGRSPIILWNGMSASCRREVFFVGTLEENISLIATALKEIQEASTFRNNVVFTPTRNEATTRSSCAAVATTLPLTENSCPTPTLILHSR